MESGRASNTEQITSLAPLAPFFGGEGSGVRGLLPAAADDVLSFSLWSELRHDKRQSPVAKRARSGKVGPKIAALFDELLSTDQP